MMPPTRIEQLNNFQDAVQSPDGLDRLRALQAVEQALPSSQGLMGMPQVQAPIPMVPRQYGGEVGTGGLVGITDDGVQIFDRSDEGVLNRSIHGGMLKGQTQTTSAPSGFSGGPTAAGTLASGTSAPSGFTISTGQDNYGNNIGDLTGTQDYYDLNFAARDAGQDTFMYGDKLMQVDPGYLRGGGINPFISNRLPENARYMGLGTYSTMPDSGALGQVSIEDYKEAPYLPTEDFSRDISGQYDSYYEANQAAKEAGSPTFMYGDKLAKTDPGLLPDYIGGMKPFISNQVPESLIDYANTLTQGQSVFNAPRPDGFGSEKKPVYLGMGVYAKHGGPVISKQYGGEVGTGGLLEVLDDGTQVFSNTEKGILNRAIHGGMLQGQTQTATAPSSFSGGTDAPGTLASGTSAAPTTLPKTAVDNSFLAPVMQLGNVQERGGIYNASDIRDAGVTLSRPSDAPETIVQQGQAQVGSMYRDPVTGKIPYSLYQPQPVNTFGQGYDLKDMDYFTANALALNEGADRFIYNDEYAAVDPGLLSNYNYSELGTKPWGASIERDKIREATVGMPTHYSQPVENPEITRKKAEGFKMGYSGRYDVPGTPPVERFRQLQADGVDLSNPYTRMLHGFKHGGSLSDTAEGLASFGRYGDNILVHMNPEELDGLASLGQITYNPVTGLPEAFSLGGIFKSIRKIAPIALAIAAPYAFGATTALGIGASSALGSFAGNLIAGAKPGDALKQGLISGLFAGGGAYLGGAASGFGDAASAGNVAGGTSAITSGGINQGGLNISNPAFQSSPLNVALKAPPPNISNVTSRGISQFGQSSAPAASLAGSVDKMIPQSNLVFKSTSIPKTYSQSIGSANQIGLGNANVASNVTGSGQLSPNVTNQITSFGGNQGANLASNVGQGPTSIFAKGGLSKENLSRMGSKIYEDYANPKGIAKLVAMDLGTPDYDVMYANEAREKEQQLRDAGYTVDTGFDGQTVIRDSSGVTLPRNLTASMILDRALGRAPRTNLVARTDYATAKEGGLISLKHGGEFSGMVPGNGHGMEDNVYMPITEGKKQVGTLAVSPSEYVVDSYTMAALGNGNADAGAKVMDRVVKHVRKKAYGDTEQPNEISGLQALKPMMERV